MNSTLVRIRIQTAPPLEPLKAWHTFSPEIELRSINDLTSNIALALGLTDDANYSLELDGFALLPSSPIGAVRDGDTIIIKTKPHPEKRKMIEDLAPALSTDPQCRKKQKTHSPAPAPPLPDSSVPSQSSTTKHTTPPSSKPLPAPRKAKSDLESISESTSSSDSDSSDSSDSGSGSSSSSDSDSSDSDSDSDSSSSSDSDDAPIPQPISGKPNVPPQNRAHKPVSKPVSQQREPFNPLHPPVPPGQGKPSTKDRNVRRRKLRKHQAAGTVFPRAQSSIPESANNDTMQVDVRSTKTITQSKPVAPIAPAKNANKNKRRGFDKDMASTLATRVVFGSPNATPSALLAAVPVVPVSTDALEPTQPKSRYTHYHVVPPSQRTDLPPNVIVTSVDVEAVDGMDGVGEWFEAETKERSVAEPVRTAGNNALGGESATRPVDWGVVDAEWEKKWDTFVEVGAEGWKTLQIGTLLGWKALTLDPATCTPCTRIHLARITSTPNVELSQVECFVLDRPGAGDAMFGFGGRIDGDSDEGMEEREEEEAGGSRMVGVGEMVEWRVVS